MRRRRRADKRGVALIMVLGAITVLTVFLTELQEETSAELSSALAERDALKAEYFARSAVNLSRLLIASEPTIRKALPPIPGLVPPQIPIWQMADVALGVFNDEIGQAAFQGILGGDAATGKNMGLTGGRFDVKIVDEDGKFNLNKSTGSLITQLQVVGYLTAAMQGEQYNPLFEGRDADNQYSDRGTICSAIIDWADSSPTANEELFSCDVAATQNTGSKGPEDNFYQNQNVDYIRKNAPYDSLEELRLVRGMSNDDIWTNFVEPDPNSPEQRLLTVWGQEKVNVNTADPLTLLMIACANKPPTTPEPLCDDPTGLLPIAFIERARQLRALIPPGVALFGKPADFVTFMKGTPSPGAGMSLVGMASAALFAGPPPIPPIASLSNDLAKQLTVKSTRFSIYAEGVVPGYKRETRIRIHAVFDVDPKPPPSSSGILPPADQFPYKAPGELIYWRIE